MRLFSPAASVAGNTQCGLSLFNFTTRAAGPFSAASPNLNNVLLALVVHADAVGGGAARAVFEGPGQPAVSAYATTTSAQFSQPYWHLLLQYDHVAATYSAFYRFSAAAPWTLLGAFGANVFYAGVTAPRVGVGAKTWVAGRTWSCAIDAFFLTALPNVPLTAAWPAGAPFNLSAVALGAAAPAAAAPVAGWGAAALTTTLAVPLVDDDFLEASGYALGSAWTAPGVKPPPSAGLLPWIVEAASLASPAHSFQFGRGRMAIVNTDSATCTDYFAGARANGGGACLPAPLAYVDVPLRGSWAAELRLAAPYVSAGATMQCGLALFNAVSTAVPPFSAANPNVNNLLIALVAGVIAANAAPAIVVFQGPIVGTVSAGFSFTSATVPSAALHLLLQYNHVEATYSAFYRASEAAAWTFFQSVGPSVVAAHLKAPRVGVFAKSWSTGRAWACAIDAFRLTALPNAPWVPAWLPGVAVNATAAAAATAATTTFLAADSAAGPFVAALAPAGLFVGAALALGANASALAPAGAAVGGALALPSAACGAAAALGAGDAAIVRFHADFTALPPAPFLEPAAFVDCSVYAHAARAYTIRETPGGAAGAWGALASLSTRGLAAAFPTRRWFDIVPANVAAPSIYDASTPNSGATFFDALDTGLDVFVVLRPAAGAAFDGQVISNGGDAGFCGWTLNVLPGAAGVYFAASDNQTTSAAGATHPLPLSTAWPTIVHASISANATRTGAAGRRAMIWLNGRNASSAPGLPAASTAWGAAQYAAFPPNFPGDAVNGYVQVRCSVGNGWWPRIGAGIGGNTNNFAISLRHAFRGDIFEVIVLRGSSAQPGLTEAGRLALTAALVTKYRLGCDALGGSGAVPADAASVCAGALPGDSCNEACPAGWAPTRGTPNKTCAAGTWSGAPLVCARIVPACAAGAAPLPAFYASCAVVVFNESFAGGVGAWNFSGTYPFFAGADKAAVFARAPGGGGGGVVGEMLVAPNPASAAAGAPALAALHSGGDAWLAGAPGAATLSVLWTPLRAQSGLIFAWRDAGNHVRLRGGVAGGGACAVVLEAVAGGVATALGSAPCALAPGAGATLAVTFAPGGGGSVSVALGGVPLFSARAPPLPPAASGGAPGGGGVGLLLLGDGAKARFAAFAAALACAPGAVAAPPLLGGQALALTCAADTTASGAPLAACGAGGLAALLECTPAPAPAWPLASANVTEGAPPGTPVGAPLAALLAAPLAHQVLFFSIVAGQAVGAFAVANCSGQLRVGPAGVPVTGAARTFQLGVALGVNRGASPPWRGVVNITVLPAPPAPPAFPPGGFAAAASEALVAVGAAVGAAPLAAAPGRGSPGGAPALAYAGALASAAEGAGALAAPQPAGVRYVRYVNGGAASVPGPIAVAELQVFSAATGVNAALGAAASSSSTAAGGAGARAAVDGKTSPAAAAPFISAGSGAGEWLEVDLGAPITVGRVVFFNGGDNGTAPPPQTAAWGAVLWSQNAVWGQCSAATAPASYNRGPFASWTDCQAACAGDATCTAWTYILRNASCTGCAPFAGQCCWRTDGIFPLTAQADHVSQARLAAPPLWPAATYAPFAAGDSLQLLSAARAVVATVALAGGAAVQAFTWSPLGAVGAGPAAPFAVDTATGALSLAVCCLPPDSMYTINITAVDVSAGGLAAATTATVAVVAALAPAVPAPAVAAGAASPAGTCARAQVMVGYDRPCVASRTTLRPPAAPIIATLKTPKTPTRPTEAMTYSPIGSRAELPPAPRRAARRPAVRRMPSSLRMRKPRRIVRWATPAAI